LATKFSTGNVIKHNGKWGGLVWATDDDGNRKRIFKTLKDENGSPIECTPKTNRGRNRAIGALAVWREELITSEAEELAATKEETVLRGVTLGDYLDRYLDSLESTHHIERSTLASYRASAKKINATLGDALVTELTTGEVERWEAELLNAEGLSNRSVIKHHRLLSQALKYAVNCGMLPQNPCDCVKLPKSKREQPHAMTREQAADLLATLAAMNPTRVVTAARISILSGLRVGEVCALTWGDVNFERHILRVNKAIGTGEGGSYVKGTKNSYSTRDIPMTRALEDAFRDRRRQVYGEAEDAGVFPNPKQVMGSYVLGHLDGEHVNPNCISREWGQLRRLLGVTDSKGNPLRFHDLRHTYATLAVQAGMDIKSLSAMLGHADASMTLNVYASSDEQARRAAADRMAEFMGEAESHGRVMSFKRAANDD
jgi:integrase